MDVVAGRSGGGRDDAGQALGHVLGLSRRWRLDHDPDQRFGT
jgi:hypothetical protein